MLKKILGGALLVLIPVLALEGFSWCALEMGYAGHRAVQAERVALAPQAEVKPRAIRSGLSGQNVFAVHPYFGFVQDPTNSQVVNAHGFVGPDLLAARGLETYNVVVVGGSVAGNLYNYSWRRLRAALQAIPALAEKKVRLYSLAVAGYKQPQQLMALAWFLSHGVKADLVINIDGFNEMVMSLQKNAVEGVSLDYPILWKDMTAGFDSSQRRQALGRLSMYQGARAGLAALFGLFPLDCSMTASLLWRLADELPRGGERRAVASLERAQENPPYFQTGPPSVNDRSAALNELAAHWADSSKLMDAMVRATGGAYLHVLQPNQYVQDSKPLSQDEMIMAISSNPQTVEAARAGYARIFTEIPRLRASGVLFMDATGVFSTVKDSLYFDSCCHFNEEGTDILCDAIVSFLRETLFAQT